MARPDGPNQNIAFDAPFGMHEDKLEQNGRQTPTEQGFGVHQVQDVLKAMMAGARVAMMTSELLTAGISRLARMLEELEDWMEEHEYLSIAQMQGSMSQQAVAEPAAFERANYMKALNVFDPYLR